MVWWLHCSGSKCCSLAVVCDPAQLTSNFLKPLWITAAGRNEIIWYWTFLCNVLIGTVMPFGAEGLGVVNSSDELPSQLYKVSASMVLLPASLKGDNSDCCSLKWTFIGQKFSEKRELSPSKMRRLPNVLSRWDLVMDAPTLQHSDVWSTFPAQKQCCRFIWSFNIKFWYIPPRQGFH